MPIRKRITDSPRREDLRRTAKGRHPFLQRLDGPHLAVWQTIVQDGNPKGGITAAQISAITHQFHPQVLKDLIDAFLVTKVGKNANNEFKYYADDKGRGVKIQTVTVKVELFEDADGKFGTRTTLIGSDNVIGKAIRKVSERKIHMRIPLLEEGLHEDVSDVDKPVMGDTSAPARARLLNASDLRNDGGCIIDG